MSPLVSLIIPVYNVELYAEDCIRSVQNQTYQNLEIIIVDDGSTDGSGQLCDTIAVSDRRITVLHQSNMGLGPARNAGIDCATGDYILFVDSDDYIHPKTVEKCLAIASALQSDMVFFDVRKIDEFGKPLPKDLCERSAGPLSITDCVEGSARNLSFMVAWARLYAREVFGDVRFRAALHEDYDFVLRILKNVKRPYYLNEELYFYRQRPGSITQNPVLIGKRYVAWLEGCCINVKTLFELDQVVYLTRHEIPQLISFIRKYQHYNGGHKTKDDPCKQYLSWVPKEKRLLRKSLPSSYYVLLRGLSKHGTEFLSRYDRRMRLRGRVGRVVRKLKTLWVKRDKRVE